MRVGIVGAGAVGGYLAIALSAAGAGVVLLGRQRLDAPEDMVLVHRDGSRQKAGSDLEVTRELARLAGCDIVLVTVKAQHTDDVAEALASVVCDTPVVSFQNGLGNVERLRRLLGGRVLGGVVEFNIACDGPLRRKLTQGILRAEDDPSTRALASVLQRAHVRLELERDIESRSAGKLLVNLMNGVAAATGLGTRALLASADARVCGAQCILEGLAVMRAAGMHPARATILSPALLARALRLPDWLVAPIARAVIEPEARSSTLQDLDRGTTTEIEELNGAIVGIAEKTGREAPVNRLIEEIVHEHERAVCAGGQPAYVSPSDLRRRIESASRNGRNGSQRVE